MNTMSPGERELFSTQLDRVTMGDGTWHDDVACTVTNRRIILASRDGSLSQISLSEIETITVDEAGLFSKTAWVSVKRKGYAPFGAGATVDLVRWKGMGKQELRAYIRNVANAIQQAMVSG